MARVRYMSIGDSITVGLGATAGTGGFRGPTIHARGVRGLPYMTVGQLEVLVSGENRMCGGSGLRTDDVLPMVLTQAIQYTPELSTIHIGTNDATQRVGGGASPPTRAQSVANVIAMVTALRAANPDHRSLVAMITPSSDGPNDAEITATNTLLLSELQARSDYGSRVFSVDINAAFRAVGSWATALFEAGDAVHPNNAGYVVASNAWRTTLATVGY